MEWQQNSKTVDDKEEKGLGEKKKKKDKLIQEDSSIFLVFLVFVTAQIFCLVISIYTQNNFSVQVKKINIYLRFNRWGPLHAWLFAEVKDVLGCKAFRPQNGPSELH